MKTKSEITSDYVEKINTTKKYILEYKKEINQKIKEFEELADGSYGIEEIEEELMAMKSIVSYLEDICEAYTTKIYSNEYNV